MSFNLGSDFPLFKYLFYVGFRAIYGVFSKNWCAIVVFLHGKCGEVVVICMAGNARFSGSKKVTGFRGLFLWSDAGATR